MIPAIPEDYLTYLRSGARTEGGLTIEPGWFQLWPEREIEGHNRGYEVAKYAPGYLGFGSNGGGELFAFDLLGRVVMIPFIPMDGEYAVVIAESWKEFQDTIED